MKGIIFNLAEEVVTAEHGADTWDVLLDNAGLEGAYTSLGSYPDAELNRLVAAASDELGATPAEVVRGLGHSALPLLAERYPGFFEGHTCRSFLLTLNDIVHPEVRKLYPGADVPDFTFGGDSDDVLEIGYASPRRLCALAEGFVLGAADHFGETVSVEQTECLLRGDDRCLLVCRFESA
jgi:Haem-NO-binding